MRTYSVQSLPWSSASDGDVVIIAEKFNWLAFIFGPFWAFWHGMWRTAIVLLVVAAVMGGLGAFAGLAADLVSALQLLIQIALGLWANDLRRAALARRGYVERVVVAGRNGEEAEHRYFTTVAQNAAH
ncbi:MAG: DUF2628 domain-containing protein, partial [Alphaproteobacteria bacterium]|nr:DUF2628 domain-containing protein [Alphaproteobacteria bacterium]